VIGGSRLLTALVLAGAAVVSALVVVALAWDRDGERDGLPAGSQPTVPAPAPGTTPPSAQPNQPPADEEEPIGARGFLTPRIVLFGDLVRARVDVILDRTRVDPDSVRVATAFAPWEIVGDPERIRRDSGSTTHLRTTYTLRCLTSPCVPSGQSAPLQFSQARVSYAAPAGGQAPRASFPVDWPLLVVYSRFATANFDAGSQVGPSTPWRADVVTMPAVSYLVPPWLALWGAVVVGGLFVLGGAWLVYRAWPRRAPAPPPEPEPEPLPQLTPLEQALALLEDAAREDGVEERRRSLELVAEVLEEHEDARDLVHTAKVLAWSEADPEVEDTSGLAARVRTKLIAEAEEHRNGDGDVG
jgi:hypothetical protein